MTKNAPFYMPFHNLRGLLGLGSMAQGQSAKTQPRQFWGGGGEGRGACKARQPRAVAGNFGAKGNRWEQDDNCPTCSFGKKLGRANVQGIGVFSIAAAGGGFWIPLGRRPCKRARLSGTQIPTELAPSHKFRNF